MRTALGDAQIYAIFQLQLMPECGGDSDLVAIGAAAIGALVADAVESMLSRT